MSRSRSFSVTAMPRPFKRRMKSDPKTFFSFGGWTERMGALGIRLAKADKKIVQELLRESWKRVAPKKRSG
jgi:hypothetical protein